jgi:hypothetical protein
MTTFVQELDPSSCQDRDSFRARIAAGCEPIVLRGLCRGWPATRAAGQSWEHLVAYLLQFDSGAVAQAFLGDRSISGRYYYSDDLKSFNFVREDLLLADALERMTAASEPGEPSIYLGSLPADDHLPGFAEENSIAALPPSVRPRIWLGNGSSVACHYDTYDNIACVVAGRRRFTLFPPDAIGRLYVGPIDFTMAGQPVALAVGSEPGDPRYPGFESIRDRALVAELHPGDAVFLPKLWWHQVEAKDRVNLLVNYWWDAFSSGPDAPYTAMMLAMIAIAERPAAERGAWRALFDHYVFRPNGHPLAHLPKEKHGILGPLADGNYRRIRSIVMRLLRGD